MPTLPRLALILALLAVPLLAVAQPQASPVQPPLTVRLVEPPLVGVQGTILVAPISPDAVGACVRAGVVERFPWDTVEAVTEGTLVAPVRTKWEPGSPWASPMPGTVRRHPVVVVPMTVSPQSGGSIHIWVTPPTPHPSRDRIREAIEKALQTTPTPPGR